MGPKTAKAPEKTVAKDEAQVFYVTIRQTATVPAAVIVSAPSVTSSTDAPSSPSKPGAPKSPTKKEKDSSNPAASIAAPVAAAPPADEIQEICLEIIVNLLCRTDIMIDYVRRQFVKVIQEKLAAEDPEKKIGEAMRIKLKNLQIDLNGKASADLILRDSAGTDVVFKENLDKDALTVIAPLSSYTLGLVQPDQSILLLNE